MSVIRNEHRLIGSKVVRVDASSPDEARLAAMRQYPSWQVWDVMLVVGTLGRVDVYDVLICRPENCFALND